ncbi:hypothetical protein [Loktanella sp. R86503]|uniref:hypothetical protein n=1 Tax=Loktanella sp. R86503 TaxID=3093847 RepID=UPI0036DBC73F
MTAAEFEAILEIVAERLNRDVTTDNSMHKPAIFEAQVRHRISERLVELGLDPARDEQVQAFPDIVIGNFGVEVKATESDSWRCIANSVSEGKRSAAVDNIYIMYGKMGGTPQVMFADYGNSIIHVRTSHVPRFEIEIGSERSLFDQIGTTYEDFRKLDMHDKMTHIREYARGRLNEGERLWWLEDKPEDEQTHTLSMEIRLYMDLPQDEKRAIRAEAVLLCPQVCGGGRQRRKYTDPVSYMMSYRGVLCPQARDLFSAGSVAGPARGGHYVERSIMAIQDEMREAAAYLEPALFVEYWGSDVPQDQRIIEWLKRADGYAVDFTPSQNLFLTEQRLEQSKNVFGV